MSFIRVRIRGRVCAEVCKGLIVLVELCVGLIMSWISACAAGVKVIGADLRLYAKSLAGLLPVELGPMIAMWSVLGVVERKMDEMDIKNGVRGFYMNFD